MPIEVQSQSLLINRVVASEGLLAESSGVIEALAAIQTTDRGHLLLGELEVKKAEVFPKPLMVLRLGDHRSTPLHAPSQNDLSRRPRYFLGNRLDGG